MPYSTSMSKNPQAAKLDALKAAREKAASNTGENPAAIQKWISPGDCKERIRIFFDDSGSMYGKPIEDARNGCIEFMRNCIPNQTAVAVHLFNKEQELDNLNSNLIEVSTKLKEMKFARGGTPLFKCVMKGLSLAPKLTRGVLFTDGSPTDSLVPYSTDSGYTNCWLDSADVVITKTKELGGIPIDTIFFGESSSWTASQRELLQYIAEKTGGYFMVFDPAKVNFRTAFKYLAPVNRLALASESVRREIEDGKRS